MSVIIVSLKHVKDVNDNILSFIINQIVHYDVKNSKNAYRCLVGVLERRSKFTKERIEVKEFPTIASLPNILDKITVKLPQNGYYFPTNFKKSDKEEHQNDNDKISKVQNSESPSVDINPETSIDINLENTTVNEDVIKVFESFKNIEIEINMTEEEERLLDSELLAKHGNGFFIFKRS